MNKQALTRLILTIILLVFMWMGQRWALYLSMTLCALGMECQAQINRIILKWGGA